MTKVLVVGDGNAIEMLLEGCVLYDIWVEYAEEFEDAIVRVEQEDEGFDLIFIYSDDGLMRADKAAAALKIAAENMPFVIVVKPGITDDGASAGIALGNIDKIVPSEDVEVILSAFERGVGVTSKR